MIELKATYENVPLKCLRCETITYDFRKTTFLGVSAVSEFFCSNCNESFYHTLPLGHSIYYPIAFDKLSNKKYDEKARNWFAEPLIRTFLKEEKIQASIEKRGGTTKEEAIILNCLDTCFGHILVKLLNVNYFLERFKDKHLIVVIPKQCCFFVPEGAGEIWTVDLDLKLMNKWIEPFDFFFKEEIKRFNKVYLGLAFLHHDYSKIDLSSLIKIKKKGLTEFNNLDLQVTFFVRKDRIWISNSLEAFLLKIANKLKVVPFVLSLLIYRENKKIKEVKRLISHENPAVKFVVTGTGVKGGFSKDIIDLRTSTLTEEIQRRWWEEFAKTHVLIGIHGSNMLIPTSLALGFIDLIPRNKIINYSDDITISHLNPNVLFFSRFLDVYSSPRLVALHALGMLRNFKLWNKELKVEHKVWDNVDDLYNAFE